MSKKNQETPKKEEWITNQNGRPCKNLTGDVSGRLTAKEPCERPSNVSIHNKAQYWLCDCSCGGTHKVKSVLFEKQLVTRCPVCRKKDIDESKKKKQAAA